jgi:thymidylate synthase (FAD)
MQDTKNRQNSIETVDENVLDHWQALQDSVMDLAISAYQNALKSGIAKEQARALLPEGLTPSRMYMAGTLRSWMHYCQLRTGSETQKEHREIAQAIANELNKLFPVTWSALMIKGQSKC